MTRGRAKTPLDLAAMIAAANIKEPLPEFSKKFSGRVINLAKIRKSLGSSIADFLESPKDQEGFRDRYDALRAGQSVLGSIADRLADYQPGSFTSIPVTIPVTLYVNDGRLGASGYIVNALKDFPVDGVRRCAVCQALFSPQRGNSRCCSLRCRQRLNKRESRQAQKSLLDGKWKHTTDPKGKSAK